MYLSNEIFEPHAIIPTFLPSHFFLYRSSNPAKEVAEILFNHALEKMAYFKAPGYILFMDDLPVTGTQKVVKHKIFEPDIDPRHLTGVFNFTHLKKRKPND